MNKKLDLGNHLKLINDTNFKGESIRGDDNKFMEIDDQLYALIEQALEINTDNWSINGDEKLFDWYCEIRNKLCKKFFSTRCLNKKNKSTRRQCHIICQSHWE